MVQNVLISSAARHTEFPVFWAVGKIPSTKDEANRTAASIRQENNTSATVTGSEFPNAPLLIRNCD
jgi:hypothetical protein